MKGLMHYRLFCVREVSDALPFMEYEIHRQIVNKLKVTNFEQANKYVIN